MDSTTSFDVALLWSNYCLDPFTGNLYSTSTGRPIWSQSSIDPRNYRKLVANAPTSKGYRTIAYGRVVFAWVHGYYPKQGFHVDHINGDSHDNRPWNLRAVTVRENNQNRRNQGSAGIYWNKRIKRWQAQIRINGQKVYLGVYKHEHEGLEAYINACDANGYSVLPEVRNRLSSLLKEVS